MKLRRRRGEEEGGREEGVGRCRRKTRTPLRMWGKKTKKYSKNKINQNVIETVLKN